MTLLATPQKGHPFNGAVLIVHHGQVVFAKGYGYRNLQTMKLNDTASIFRIGSLSKPFTSTVVLRLAQEGRIDLHAPLSAYFPDYPHGDSIKIDNLLTHTSGIKDYLEVPAIQRLPDNTPPMSIEKLISYFSQEPLNMVPGQRFDYSNSNYILLAAVIEKVTGRKFEAVTRDLVFTPAGMTHTGFDFTGLKDPNRTTGYARTVKGLRPMVDFDSTLAPGCGSIYTTTGDLYRFYRALCDGRLIDTAMRTAAWIPRKGEYGYGWFSYTLYGKKCISHAGGVPGFYSNMAFYPDDDLCIILLSNFFEGDLTGRADELAGVIFHQKTQSSGL